MIGFLRGKVHNFGLDYCLLDVRDVGYRIIFNHPEELSIGKEIIIYTYQSFTEYDSSLYGFLTLEEYDLFVKLISVKGLGPKVASNILSRSSADRVIEAIENNDIDFIMSLPGIGKKTASQIILDLKGKLIQNVNNDIEEGRLKDIGEALKSLGYKNSEIKPILKALANEELSDDELMRKALSMLVR